MKFSVSVLLVTFIIYSSAAVWAASPKSKSGHIHAAPIVTIPQGSLQGTVSKSRDGRPYNSYFGIPYASPPPRFQAPQPPPIPGWKGVRNASAPASICIQIDFFTNQPTGSEDCLFLNVFTTTRPDGKDPENKLAKGALKPVIVYIHGGAFYTGAGNFQGAGYLMDEPVVFVTINYRLAALGFLNIGWWHDGPVLSQVYDNVASGNMGMKDQVMALRWVQNNIKAFGGDPNKVTIMGTSAGSVSVTYHVLSPMSTGLFQGAIACSGSALNPWAFTREPKFYAKKLGQTIGCPTADPNELLRCLLEKDAASVATWQLGPLSEWPLDPIASFAPTIESRTKGQDVFLAEAPEILYQKGHFNKVGLLIGDVKDEGIFLQAGRVFVNDTLTRELNEEWFKIAPVTFGLKGVIPDRNLVRASMDIRAYYLGIRSVAVNESAKQLEDLYSDRNFFHGVRSTILYHARSGNPVYPFLFCYAGGWMVLGRTIFGAKVNLDDTALHGEDMNYAFSTTPDKNWAFIQLSNRPALQQFSKEYVRMLVSFAANGKPDPSTLGNVNWPPVSQAEASRKEPLKWYHIDSPPSRRSEPFERRMLFWDHLLKKYA